MKKTKVITQYEYDNYITRRNEVGKVKRFFRKSFGSTKGLKKKILLLGLPILASVLVVSVLAAEILIDSKNQNDIVFELPEADVLSEAALNRDLDSAALLRSVDDEDEVKDQGLETTKEVETEPQDKIDEVGLDNNLIIPEPLEQPPQDLIDIQTEEVPPVTEPEPVAPVVPAAPVVTTPPTTKATVKPTTRQVVTTTAAPVIVPVAEYVRYAKVAINLRKGPGTGYEKIGVVGIDQKVTVNAVSGTWSKVVTEYGQSGFVASELLKKEAPIVTTAPTAAPTQTEAPAPDPAPEQSAPLPSNTTTQAPSQTAAATPAPAPAPAPAPQNQVMYVNTEYARIRSGPSTNFDQIGFALQGHKVKVLSRSDGWARVQTEGGVIGHIALELLSSRPVERLASYLEMNKPVYVTKSYVYIRSGPSTDDDAVGGAQLNEKLMQLTTDGSWSKVKKYDGTVGYIRNDLITSERPEYVIESTTPPTSPPTQPQQPTNSGFTNTNVSVYVSAEVPVARLRQGPSTSTAVVGNAFANQKLLQLAKSANWSKVKDANGVIGYIANSLITTTAPQNNAGNNNNNNNNNNSNNNSNNGNQAQGTGYRDVNKVVYVRLAANVRSKDNTSSDVITSLPIGTKITQLATNGTWSKIKLSSGATGYMMNSLFQTTPIETAPAETNPPKPETTKPPTPSPPAAVSAKGQAVANIAVAQVGTWYRYGACSPDKGFDCSGLVKYAYNQAGFPMGQHGSNSQARAYGRTISYVPGNYSSLAPGDLLFFNPYGTSGSSFYSHVAIYIGGGKFVHAPRPGKQVQIVYMSNYRSPALVKRIFD